MKKVTQPVYKKGVKYTARQECDMVDAGEPKRFTPAQKKWLRNGAVGPMPDADVDTTIRLDTEPPTTPSVS